MPEFPPQNLIAWQVSMTLLQLLAMGMTIFRLVRRWRSRKLWWDDYVVCLPLLLDGILIVTTWTKYHRGRRAVKINSAISSFWLGALIYYTILWSCRISLALTLTRIFPPRQRTRRYALGLVIGFIATYLGCLLYIMITCRSRKFRYRIRTEDCKTMKNGGFVASYEFIIFDILSDILLIASPLHILWHVNLPKPHRRIILSLFSSSILSLLGTIVVFVVWCGSIRPGSDYYFLRATVGYLESGISLISCNLLIVVMACYSALQARRSAQQSSPLPFSQSSNKDTTGPDQCEAKVPSAPLLSQAALTTIYDDEF